nr:putative ABC transporter, solute binding protein [uncultured archaeon]
MEDGGTCWEKKKKLGGDKNKKMKTKIVMLVGITICTMLLVSPALASDADTLEIYGNANEDDTIDMRDLTYVKLIFFGKKPETELADAKYDGQINPLDFIQIKLIIVGKENELTLVDSADRTVTVKKPVDRITAFSTTYAEALRIVNAKENVVGVSSAITKDEIFFPELSKLPSFGGMWSPDIEALIALEPDVVLTSKKWPSPAKLEDKLVGTDIIVIRMEFTDPEVLAKEMNKLGYMLNKNEEAGDFIEFYQGYLDTIKDKIEELSEDDKQRVYLEYSKEYQAASEGSVLHQLCTMAGGINIAKDLEGSYPEIDAEWLLLENPDIMIKWCPRDYPKAKRDELMGRSVLANLSAVKDDEVYAIAYEITTRPAGFVGVAYMAKWFYPEQFTGLDPKAIYQEYLTEFQGVDIDIDVAYPAAS